MLYKRGYFRLVQPLPLRWLLLLVARFNILYGLIFDGEYRGLCNGSVREILKLKRADRLDEEWVIFVFLCGQF